MIKEATRRDIVKKEEPPIQRNGEFTKEYEHSRLRALRKASRTRGVDLSLEQNLKLIMYESDNSLEHRDYPSAIKYLSNALGYAEGSNLYRSNPEYIQAIHHRINQLSRKVSSERKEDSELKKNISNLERGISDLEGKLEHPHTKQAAALASIIGFVGSILFLSANITGNVVNNSTQITSTWIGMFLFIVGVIGAFFYLNRK